MAFAGSGRSFEDEVLSIHNRLTAGKLQNHRLIDASVSFEIDVLQDDSVNFETAKKKD
jgi:hypothetical protein